MIAAIYARKSTEQTGVADAEKSIMRQIEHARAYATRKGWSVAEEHVYADDAVSGAETKRLVDRQRLLNAIDSGPPFQALIMRDTSRFSRRDGDEAFGELKAIAKAGVEVWFYQDGQRFTFGTLAANVTGFLSAEFAADYRRQIAAWTYAAMEQKARAGYVTGGRVFGYDNVRVDGHVERRVNETEAAVVRRIYDLYAAGRELSSIAHTLNADGASCPRAQQGRVNGWCASSVREVLKRPLYRGDLVWGRARKRDREGQVSPTPRPPQEWLRRSAPELRVVSEDLARAVDARRVSMRQRALGQANGRLMGRPPGEGSPYLLTGLLTCGVCGGGWRSCPARVVGAAATTTVATSHGERVPPAARTGCPRPWLTLTRQCFRPLRRRCSIRPLSHVPWSMRKRRSHGVGPPTSGRRWRPTSPRPRPRAAG